MLETGCQEEIAHAKSLGFYCTTKWDILSLIFLVILKGSYLLKTCSSQIMGICMEKSKSLWNARSYVSAIEETMPEGPFWTQSHIRSLAVARMSRCLYGSCQDQRRKRKNRVRIVDTKDNIFLHLVTTVVTTLVTIIVTIGLGLALYILPFRATILLSLLSLIRSIF